MTDDDQIPAEDATVADHVAGGAREPGSAGPGVQANADEAVGEGEPGSRRLGIEDLDRFEIPEQPAISPDGATIVYVLRGLDVSRDRVTRMLWRTSTDGSDPHQLTHGPDDTDPVFSPDGRTIAFLREHDGTAQLHLLPTAGGEPSRVTALRLGAGRPAWSPDSRQIAFTAAVDSTPGTTGPDAGTPPIVADNLSYQDDGTGRRATVWAQLHLHDLASGSTRQLTFDHWNAGAPVWSPDGTSLAFGSAPAHDADLTDECGIFHLSTATPDADPIRIGPATAHLSPAGWSREDTVLAVGSLDRPNRPASLLRLRHGDVRNLTAALDRHLMTGEPGYPGGLPQLTPDNTTVVFCAREAGCTALYRVAVDGGEIRTLVDGPGINVTGLSVAARSARAAVILTSRASFGEVAVIDLDHGDYHELTDYAASNLAGADLYPRVERQFLLSDGATMQGWLMREDTSTGPQPLLLDIHGGPHNAWNAAADDVHLYHQVLVSRGWGVLLLNPRGSDGYGSAFYTALEGRWGTADAQDFLEAVDQLVVEGIADPARLAVTGYSYGGYMTCYLTGHGGRFAAAVAGGAVTDLRSLVGTSDAGHHIASFELAARPFDDPDRYAEMSPISRVDAVTTPTLVLHGEADLRCPVGQAQQWFTALRERQIPTRLVLYPGASHLFPLTGTPSQRADFNRRIIDWVEHHAGTGRSPLLPEHWQRRLDTLARRYEVPGAALGILRIHPGRPDERITLGYGVLSLATEVAVTPDSLFQIGSITKVWTATFVMKLVEDGLLDLDTPVCEVLPELRLADPETTKRLTVRHLLTHTSGIDGDLFTDTGRGDDCLQRYVALLGEARQLHPLGATFSYCNAGFAVLGRIIETLTATTWDDAIRDGLIRPLQLHRTVTLPEDALLHRTAVGHLSESGTIRPTETWSLPRAVGPMGAIICTAGDLLTFARIHLSGGVASDGHRLIGTATVTAMADNHADLPDVPGRASSWGLGWGRHQWGEATLIGHDGSTIGQDAFLLLLPDQGLAVTLLTDGGDAAGLYRELFKEIFSELAGLTMPPPAEPPATPATTDVRTYVGRYERSSVRFDVRADDDGSATLQTALTGPLARLLPDPRPELRLIALDERHFFFREPDETSWTPVTFVTLPTGEHVLFTGGRATPKIA